MPSLAFCEAKGEDVRISRYPESQEHTQTMGRPRWRLPDRPKRGFVQRSLPASPYPPLFSFSTFPTGKAGFLETCRQAGGSGERCPGELFEANIGRTESVLPTNSCVGNW